jgi:hypothetical protein
MATTKKAAPAKKVVGKPALKGSINQDNSKDAIGKKLDSFTKELGKKIEHHWYNMNVAPLVERYNAGEVSESLTSSVENLQYPG